MIGKLGCFCHRQECPCMDCVNDATTSHRARIRTLESQLAEAERQRDISSQSRHEARSSLQHISDMASYKPDDMSAVNAQLNDIAEAARAALDRIDGGK